MTYRNDSVLYRSESAILHKTVNKVVFFVKCNENTYAKGRTLTQMHRVVPQTKIGKRLTISHIYNKGARRSNARLSSFVHIKMCVVH